MKLYTNTCIENTIAKYIDLGGQLDIIDENSCLLAFNLAVLSAPNYKYLIIKDKYLNDWSSAYTVKKYNKLPKKYSDLINKI